MVTGVLHGLFILYRLLFRHGSWKKYILLSAPALLLEYYLERLGRPKLHPNGELRSPGEDMAAAGVTEYCWDIVHVTWIVLVLVGIFGEWAWWIGVSYSPPHSSPEDRGLRCEMYVCVCADGWVLVHR